MQNKKGTFLPQNLDYSSTQLLNLWSKPKPVEVCSASQLLNLNRQIVVSKSSIGLVQMYDLMLLHQRKNLFPKIRRNQTIQAKSKTISPMQLNKKKISLSNLVLVVGHVGPADRRHCVVHSELDPSLKPWRKLLEYTNLIS